MPDEPKRDAHQGVILVLAVTALAVAVGTLVAGDLLADGALLDTGTTVALFTGALVAVAAAQRERQRTRAAAERPGDTSAPPPPQLPADLPSSSEDRAPGGKPSQASAGDSPAPVEPLPAAASQEVESAAPGPGHTIGTVRVAAAMIALSTIGWDLVINPGEPPGRTASVAGAGFCLLAAGLWATVARYLGSVAPRDLPEAPGLARFARVLVWVTVLGALSVALPWAGQPTLLYPIRAMILLVAGLVGYGLFTAPPQRGAPLVVPLDFPVLAVLGARLNVVASVLDAGERQLGIDLRSTWALTVVRRSLEPVAIGFVLLGWASSSLTRVALHEEGLLERLGVPVGAPLAPGLHLHCPWPLDRVFRIPALRVQALAVGHEGAESSGPEDILWARRHAANEYTLLLGNGRELITIDAAVQYRIADSQDWLYHWQNPAQALSALAHRAVMRDTVDRTLGDALSQNVVSLTTQMRQTVQRDADVLGLGVEVLDLTVGGMHPPVPVAGDYEAVVSAELRKSTASVEAQAYRNRTVPAAEAEVFASENLARAEFEDARGKAAGEAWAFRALESEYRAAPADYFFRRRLETLESGLGGRPYTVIDARIQRDGGELWLTQ